MSGNNGGAVSAQGTTVISGVEIKDNSSYAGGGIAILASTTKISGGAVHDNTATLGGGVYNNADMSVSGTAKIHNNSQGNVYLPSSKIINIDAPLSDGAVIGVNTKTAPTDGSPVSITGANAADYSSYFTSDDEKYVIANGTDNVVQLTTAPAEKHEHNDMTFTAWTETDSLPDAAGNYYLTENVTLTDTWNVPSGETNLCLNGKTITQTTVEKWTISIGSGSTCRLYDCEDGGKITGEQGVSVGGGTFDMYGGSISDIRSSYAAVYVHNQGTFYMSSGKISGNYNNSTGGEAKNLFIASGVVQIDTSNLLADSVNIGVTTGTEPTDASPVNITGTNAADYSRHFYSDNEDYEIVNGEDNVVQLAVKAAPDTQPPTGKIEIEDNSWKSFLNSITFGLFFKETKNVTITAEDTGSGVDKINYYLSIVELTETQVKELGADVWQEDDSFSIVPDAKWIIYAKITDKAGNVTYLSSDGLVFDATPPVISGVKDGETYNTPQTVTVTDAMSDVESVTVDGEEVTLTDDCQFTLGTADNPQTIVVTDKAGNTTTVTVTVKEHTHNYGKWQQDDKQHWKTCACGDETGRGNHDYGDWITEREATETEEGTKYRECQTCSYRQTETIPAMGTEPGSGTVTPEVKPGVNAPATNISTPTEELKDMLLTDAEKQKVQNGTNIRIVLEVQDAGNTVSASERAAVQQALNGFTVGQYLNIDLYKLVGEERTDITETAKKIRIVITVPDSLKNADSSKTRTFTIIRIHDGKAEFLSDSDNNENTITIETDRFSTYAIAYKDTSNKGSSENDEKENAEKDSDNGNKDNGNNDSDNDDSSNDSNYNSSGNTGTTSNSSGSGEPETGDNAPLELHATLAMIAGFTWLLLYFSDGKRGMTEQTKKKLVGRLVAWAKRGGKIRKCLALAVIFVLLVYYHSIGKKTCAELKECANNR